ncbi:MAG: hypothetical protein EOO59_15740 [Hymenobacter sp.]|nr:MAG: hypothetical protein EOO59_15740 [Hymenobacter sp.]
MSKDHYARHHQVRQVLATYSEAVASVPALARLAQQYHQRLAQLSSARPAATEDADPDQPASASLLAQLAKAAGALYLLYKSVGALGLALGLPQGARAYRQLDAPLLATAATALSQLLAANAG